MQRQQRQSGFSLLELIIVVAILLVVTAIVFGNVNSVRQHATVQKGAVEGLQDARGTIDILVRDLRNAGYPNSRMYSTAALAGIVTSSLNGTTYYQSRKVAFGVVSLTDTSMTLEGDVNNDGLVEQVMYRMEADPAFGTPSGKCPCVLQRNVWTKTADVAAGTITGNTWDTLVGGVVNSGSAPLSLYGSTTDAHSNTVTLDTAFSAYKSTPVFQSVLDSSGKISAVVVNLDVIGRTPDPQNGLYPFATLSATSRVYQP